MRGAHGSRSPSLAPARPRLAGPIIVALLLAATLARSLSAATLHVPADHPTVRDGVDAAASGDTILVAPGVHAGGVFINGKAVTIASGYLASGDTAMVSGTILSGVDGNPCSGGARGCVGNAVLEFGDDASGSQVVGLTLTDGENGIASGSTVDVTRCRVVANGDGVDYVAGSGGTFRNSLFAANTDDGIDLNGRMSVLITDNDIRDNRDDGIEFRLYAHAGPTSAVDIIGNRITGNGEDGVQIIDYPSTDPYVIRVERNLFLSNFDASGLSAAIGCMPHGETIEALVGAPVAELIQVTNNSFIGEKNGVVGGANLMALNNVFTDTQGTALLRVGGGSIASYCLFWNNVANHAESNLDPQHLLYAPPGLDVSGRPTPASPAIDAGTAAFDWQGQTVWSMSVTDYAGRAPDLGAFETAANAAPLVSAGPDRSVTLVFQDAVEQSRSGLRRPPVGPTFRAEAVLEGSVTDDGLPYPPAPSTAWSVVSGPGKVEIASRLAAETRATFSAPGTYVLRLTASDGLLSASDLVEVTVLPAVDEPPSNKPPVVDAGPDRAVMIPADAILDGTVTDDGRPAPPGVMTTRWSAVSGPGPVTFQDSSLIDTRAGFTIAGTYILRLAASDGAVEVHDLVQVTVLPPPPALERRVGAGSDDAEESESGTFVRNASDLDLVYDSGNQTVGLRFTDIGVPPGATIIRAHIQFEADAAQSEPTSLLLQGQAADHPATFVNADRNVSDRPRTAASTTWSPLPWTVAGEAGPDQRTTDLAAVIQEIVDRPGWASGSAIVILITGTGKRTARTQEIDPSGAALLQIEYGGLDQGINAGATGVDVEGPAGPGMGERSDIAIEPPSSGSTTPTGFALHSVIPQPSRGTLRVDFTLADDGPATLELMDVTGRRVITRDLGGLGPGRQTIVVAEGLPVGVFLVRLTQAGRALVKKAAVLR